jgi:hypothetical protein
MRCCRAPRWRPLPPVDHGGRLGHFGVGFLIRRRLAIGRGGPSTNLSTYLHRLIHMFTPIYPRLLIYRGAQPALTMRANRFEHSAAHPSVSGRRAAGLRKPPALTHDRCDSRKVSSKPGRPSQRAAFLLGLPEHSRNHVVRQLPSRSALLNCPRSRMVQASVRSAPPASRLRPFGPAPQPPRPPPALR